ncbi:MAG: FkbM family methyltransferase [Bacteroidales bacterium]|nr:FkbM family methyltransferase [Bacteroidales bacterium]
MLIENIKQSNSNLRVKEVIKKDGIPIILYGAALAAEYLYNDFVKDGICFDEVAVDRSYLGFKTEFFGNEIMAIEDIYLHYSLVSIVIGFYVNDLSIIEQKIEKLKQSGLNISKVLMPDISLIISPERVFRYDFIEANSCNFQWLYENLEDEKSKKVLIAFINQRINMQLGYLDKLKEDNQYFPSSFFSYNEKEVFIDCGAYDGDTIGQFIEVLKDHKIKGFEAIYAFEPDPKNFEALYEKHKYLKVISFINKGVWSEDATLYFRSGEEMMSMLAAEGNITVEVTTIDKTLNGRQASFIKMDIQGAELEALKGAEKTIIKYSPKLAICVYHNKEDLIEIPKYIKKINSNYKIYLRAHEIKAAEVVLYAVV